MRSQPVASRSWSPSSSFTPLLAKPSLTPLLAVVALAASLAAPVALADGDPASDYLISQPVFLPIDNPVSPGPAATFANLVRTAEKNGLEIRVAVISSKYDLGSVPILFPQPQRYVDFLGQELFYWYKHEILVVMPNGYGIYDHGRPTTAQRAVLAKLAPAKATNRDALTAAATVAVEALAKQAHVSLVGATAATKKSTTGSDRLEIALAALGVAVLAGSATFARRRWRRS